MANNRMYLVHDASGQRVLLAKHFGEGWTVWDAATASRRLNDAFKAEAEHSGWPSTGWHLEFEHHKKSDDPLQPSTSETWQDANGQWHLSKGENVSNIKIDQYENAEDAIRNHARTIKGCRNLTYSVCTSNFDAIWEHSRPMAVQRHRSDAPRLALDFGRHHAFVTIDDAVPMGEVMLVEDSAP